MKCIVCGSSTRSIGKRSDFVNIDGYARFVPSLESFDRNIVTCNRCGVAFIDPMYDAADIELLYGARYREFSDEIGSRHFAREKIPVWLDQFKSLGIVDWKDEFEAKHGRKPKMIDVGCGYGRILHLFDLMGFEVEGIDLDPKAVDHVRSTFGYRVERRHLSDTASLGKYDAVTLIHVIEHFPDLETSMRQVVDLIAPGGCLVVETPWADDFGRYDERYRDIYHTIFFNHLALCVTGLNHGLRVRGVYRTCWCDDNGHHKYLQVLYTRDDARAAPHLAPSIITDLGALYNGLERASADATSHIWSLETEKATLTRKVAERDRQLDAILTELAVAQNELAMVQDEIRALQHSRSWRATAPLRTMASLARGFGSAAPHHTTAELTGRPVNRSGNDASSEALAELKGRLANRLGSARSTVHN